MPTFNDYFKALSLKDENERALALSILDMKRQRLVFEKKGRQARLASIAAGHARAEAKTAYDRVKYASDAEHYQEMQEKARLPRTYRG